MTANPTALTARLARWAALHRRRVIAAWGLALVASLAIVAVLLPSALTTEQGFTGTPSSERADQLIADRFGTPDRVTELVIVRSADATVDDPAFRRHAEAVLAAAQGLGKDAVLGGTTYWQSRDASLVSRDRHATVVPVTMAGDRADADEHAGDLREAVLGVDAPGYSTLITGQASIDHDFQKVAETDLQTGESLGIPIALVILALVFGALVAALLPALLGIAAIVVALALTALVGQAFALSFFVVNMLTMMGLAVGIDYSLFVVSRYREERAAGHREIDAITRAGGTASRAVLYSGLTVVIALVGMLIVPTTIFFSLATGAILVVLVAVVAALTLLPAVLGVLGDRVDRVRIPFVGRRPAADGIWARTARATTRRPVLGLVGAAGVLVALAVPYLSVQTGASGISTLPDGLLSKQGFQAYERDFAGGGVSPVQVVVKGETGSTAVTDGIARLRADLAAAGPFGAPAVTAARAGDATLLTIPMRGDATSDATLAAVRTLRDTTVPAAFAGAGTEALVTGETARNLDYLDITDSYAPIVFGLVLGLSFLLLMVAFRSIVVPATAIVMNLLSVGAAYGLLVLVAQEGFGADLLGFQQVDAIEAWLPLFLFSVLFGLSMDYHVLLLSRIRERWLETGDTRDAIDHGVAASARLITGAALIMVAVFAGFAAGDLVMFQQMGFGLAVAVLIDATLVRTVLVPATMTVLGPWNWYLPRFLRWLPEVDPEGAAGAPAPAGAPAA